MRTILLCLVLSSACASAKDTYVHTYQRKDGTIVEGHHRTTPNKDYSDNYSTKGNINPYTGKEGTVNPPPAEESPSE